MCVSISFACSYVRKETKIEAAHWVQAHAYAWTHSPPVRSWLTHTCQRLNLSWHTPPQLCNAVQQHAVWGRLGEVCLLYICLPSMEFMKELRDQTAADGVCLAAMLALLYPVGQYNWRFLSHQVSNSCCPAARCLSKCVRREREGRGFFFFFWKHWLTETQIVVVTIKFWLRVMQFPLTLVSLHYWYLRCACIHIHWKGSFKMTRQYICVYAQGSVWDGDLRGATQLVGSFGWSRCREAGSIGWVMTQIEDIIVNWCTIF